MGKTGFLLKFKKLSGSNGSHSSKFGTFGGVFTPDVLTILGVIMYLRLGWVVGNAGFLGAIAIILLAKSVTLCTGLSMASITTNIRIGSGGAYSIITKSLGLEAGGSIGIPFYISQTLSAALYIIGFTEGWIRIFPGHLSIIVSIVAWISLMVISYISAHFAIRIQYFIMFIIACSIISVVLTPKSPTNDFVLIGSFQDTDFWHVFAVFFPAVTGIMAGANMSGELKNPRKAIPIGTLSAIIITMFIYITLAYIAGRFISPGELRSNQMALVDNSLWSPVVLAGVLAATFSSALGSMIGAPRILQALAEHKSIPYHTFFATKASNNEPRNAIIITGFIIIVAISFGNLNALASLITMFFLITYGMLNFVVFIQQSMKMISFRPTFRVPRFVPLIGACSCIGIMFLINPIFSILAFITIIVLYVWFTKKGMQSEFGDIRGGMLLMLAERASRLAAQFPRHQISWKPDLLIPIDDPKMWSGSLLLIKSIAYPSGSIFAFTVKNSDVEETGRSLNELLEPLNEQHIPVNSIVLEDSEFLHGAKLVIQTLKGGTLRPNTLFLTLGEDSRNDDTIRNLCMHATYHKMGVMILHQNRRTALGMQKDVNLWLRDKSPNWHLAMLIALQLQLNWRGKLNLITVSSDPKDEIRLYTFLDSLSDQVRLPSLAEFHVLTGEFKTVLETSPRADINIFGLADTISFVFMRDAAKSTKSSCLFIGDSGQESALV
ncbi:MAG: Na-K-Cl cotransporter [Candidatus Latescibacteria bacterium]|nr:Na-K-Cl cotransporter [Candidatus Latescibacterota bacterium]